MGHQLPVHGDPHQVLLTGHTAPTWRPLGIHGGSWASPGDSSGSLPTIDCPAPVHYPASHPTFVPGFLAQPPLGRSFPMALSLHQQSPVTLGLSILEPPWL